MILKGRDLEKAAAMEAVKLMAAAARTAPKACGEDDLHITVLSDSAMETLADYTLAIGEEQNIDFFIRDSKLLRQSHCVLLIGISNKPLGLTDCGYCGFENCTSCYKKGGHCALKLADLGIAVGSAVSVASDHRMDNLIAYSIGKGAVKMKIFPENVTNIYAVPLSTSGKNIFFDRESIQQK